jgi:hypothetical protein
VARRSRLPAAPPLLALALVLAAVPAPASLSASQKALVRDHYAQADPSAAARLRALLARPDLSAEEAAEAFTKAARRARFDERRLAFVRSLIFGPASQAARSELVPAVVAGLLGRSAEVAASSAADDARAEELLRIHRFVAGEIAGAGKPPRTGHDREAGIRDDALRACVRAYREHLALPVLERGRIKGALRVARAQAEIALIELALGLHAITEVAAWIGAGAAERDALEKTGVLVIGLDGAPAAKAAAAVQLLASAPQAARGASVLWIGKPWPRGLGARRAVLAAQAPLAGTRRADAPALWPDAVLPSSPDAALAEIAFTLGRAGAAALAGADADFGAAAQRALARARAGGKGAVLGVQALDRALDRDAAAGGTALSEIGLLAHAAQLLLLDVPRATSAALARAGAGRFEPLEQLALALGMLATGEGGGLVERIVLGRTGEAGGLAPVEVSGIRGAPARVERFSIEGHEIALSRAEDGAVTGVTRGGKPVSIAELPMARVPGSAGEQWAAPAPRFARPGLSLHRLVGQPEVGFADAARFVVRSPVQGRHAAAVRAPGPDFEAQLELLPLLGPAAVVARASAGASDAAGVALMIEPGDAPKASLLALDGVGGKAPLAGPVPLPRVPAGGYRVRLTLRGRRVEADVAGAALAADLPIAGGSADVAFSPATRCEMEIRNLKLNAVVRR